MRQCHTQALSKSNASSGDMQKPLAPQAVLSYPVVGQASAWRQIVLVVDILSVGVDHASIAVELSREKQQG